VEPIWLCWLDVERHCRFPVETYIQCRYVRKVH
jgi:hypothetical protein